MEYIALCASLFLKNALISERKFVTLCTGIGLSFLLFCHYKDTHFLQQTEIPMPFLCTNTSYYCQLAKLELIIPAINLSSMTQSRLRQRVAEIGVRRSFGSTRGNIMWQVLAENLVLTCIAGLVGLLFCVLFALAFGSTLFSASTLMLLNEAPTVDVMMLMHTSTFGYALLFCLILNLLSAGIPAWKASRVSITDALSNQ